MKPIRIRQRFPLLLPVRILVRKLIDGLRSPKRRAVLVEETVTENISSTGCYVWLSREPEIGSKVRMEIIMQGDKKHPHSGKVFCRGTVVRVEKPPVPGKVGVACTIDHYRLAASLGAQEAGYRRRVGPV